MEFNPVKFRELIENCIGSGSITAFASRCGISREHASRMLSNAARPSRNTLKKIASAYPGKVTYEELLTACGYASSPADARKELPLEKRVSLNAKDLSEGLKALTKGVRSHRSIYEFMEEYEMIYGCESSSKILVTKPREYEGDKHPGAEVFSIVETRFEDRLQAASTWFVIYYAETKGGNVIVMDAAMDGESLLEAGIMNMKSFENANKKEIEEAEYLYRIKPKGEIAEKLLKALFGGESYVTAVTGFGFYLDRTPENLREFLADHQKVFSPGELKEFYDLAMQNKNCEDAFLEFEDDETGESGYEAMIAKVMRDETKLPFHLYRDDADKPRNCIMIEGVTDCFGSYVGEYDIEKLKKFTEQYARELGVDKYGAVHVTVSGTIEDQNIFDVRR